MAVAPYPLLADVLTQVRVAVNDAIVSIGGQTLKDTAAFTPYYANRGYQMLQQELVQLGYNRFVVPGLIIRGLPASTDLDTQYQSTLSWNGFSDGVVLNTGIVLPQTLIKPLRLAERVSSNGPNTAQFWKMSGPDEEIMQIPSIPKTYRNKIWLWNSDPTGQLQAISLPGTTGLTDLRIDFASYLPDFLPNTNVAPSQFPGTQVVPILRSTDALAWAIGYVFSYARNDDPTVCAYARDEFRRAAAIIAGAKLPTQMVQAQ